MSAIHLFSQKIPPELRESDEKSVRRFRPHAILKTLDTAPIIPYNACNARMGTSTRAASPQRAFGRCEKAARRRRIHPGARPPKGNRVGGRRCAGYSAKERSSFKGYAREGISKWKWYRVFIAFLPYGGRRFSFIKEGNAYAAQGSYRMRTGLTGSAAVRSARFSRCLTTPGHHQLRGRQPASDALPNELCAEHCPRRAAVGRQAHPAIRRDRGLSSVSGKPAKPICASISIFRWSRQNILPLSGSSQGVDLVCKAFINPGDTVLTENPTFLGNMQTLRLYQQSLVPVESDDGGLKIDALEAAVKKHHPKMLYCIPTFQNPTGRTLAPETARAYRRDWRKSTASSSLRTTPTAICATTGSRSPPSSITTRAATWCTWAAFPSSSAPACAWATWWRTRRSSPNAPSASRASTCTRRCSRRRSSTSSCAAGC